MSKFAWTKEMTDELIQLYEERPALWDIHDKEYKWKSTRQRLLEELGEIFGCDNTALLKKIKNLRDQYRSERKTVRERDDNYVSRWRFYEPLSFLDSVIDPLPTATTANYTYEMKEVNTDDPLHMKIEPEDLVFPSTSHSSWPPKETKNKNKKLSPQLPKASSACVTLAERRSAELPKSIETLKTRDEFDGIGIMFASTLRNMKVDSVRDDATQELVAELMRWKRKDRETYDKTDVEPDDEGFSRKYQQRKRKAPRK